MPRRRRTRRSRCWPVEAPVRAVLVLVGVLAAVLGGGVVAPGTARAATADACLSDDPAIAPPPSEIVWSVHSHDPPITMRCGQESTTGVRHIDVGHPIGTNIRAFALCTQNIALHGENVGPGTAPDSTQRNYTYGSPPRTAIMSFENKTGDVITAFTPKSGPRDNDWVGCAGPDSLGPPPRPRAHPDLGGVPLFPLDNDPGPA